MNIKIIRRQLKACEISQLVSDTRLYANLIYVSPNRWRKFPKPYCLMIDGNFSGVCAVSLIGGWVKIGPLVLLNQYKGRGYGKVFVSNVIKDNCDRSLFISSSNLSVKNIVEPLGFIRLKSVFFVPWKLLTFLLFQMFEYLNMTLIVEFIRKHLVYKRSKRMYFVRRK